MRGFFVLPGMGLSMDPLIYSDTPIIIKKRCNFSTDLLEFKFIRKCQFECRRHKVETGDIYIAPSSV